MSIRAHYPPDILIQPATDAELMHEAELAGLEETSVIVDAQSGSSLTTENIQPWKWCISTKRLTCELEYRHREV